jgi:hypothetical protein
MENNAHMSAQFTDGGAQGEPIRDQHTVWVCSTVHCSIVNPNG